MSIRKDYQTALEKIASLMKKNEAVREYLAVQEQLTVLEKDLKKEISGQEKKEAYPSFKIKDGQIIPLVMKPTIVTKYIYDVDTLLEKFGTQMDWFIKQSLNSTALAKADKQLDREVKTYLTSKEMYNESVMFRGTAV